MEIFPNFVNVRLLGGWARAREALMASISYVQP